MQHGAAQRHGIRCHIEARHHVVFKRYDPDRGRVGRQVEDVKADRDSCNDPPGCRVKAKHGLAVITSDPDTAGADRYAARQVAPSRQKGAHRRIVDRSRFAGGLQEVWVRDGNREHIEPWRAADAIEPSRPIARDPETIALGGRRSRQVGKIHEPRAEGWRRQGRRADATGESDGKAHGGNDQPPPCPPAQAREGYRSVAPSGHQPQGVRTAAGGPASARSRRSVTLPIAYVPFSFASAAGSVALVGRVPFGVGTGATLTGTPTRRARWI